jgi:CDP-glycerol glycerophosphotransferase
VNPSEPTPTHHVTADGRVLLDEQTKPARLRLSVVLPVFGVEAYLPECLDSILQQSPEDIEVVAVDDCSADGCGEILDTYALRDPRVSVVHLGHNVGLGEARNIGVERAKGEYVWFIDSDDWLPEGTVTTVLERLDQVRPDVLVVDFAQAQPDGTIERNVWQHLFRDPSPREVFKLAEHPSLLSAIMAAWNKVVRRDYLARLGLRFGAGYYEDIAVTYPLLLAADRIALLDRVCYYYRRGRQGSILHTLSSKHFDLFEEYERISAFIADHREIGNDLATAVFDRTVRHALTVYATPGLLPAGRRRDYFRRLARYFQTHRPAGYRPPSGLRGLQYQLVERDAHLAYTVIQPLNKIRIALRKAVDRMRGAAGRMRRGGDVAIRLAYYQLHRRLPIDEGLVVYAAYWYGGYACNPRAIYEKARELAPEMRGVWVVRKDRVSSLPPGVDYVVDGSWDYLRVMARAKYLVNNVNFPHHTPKRSGSVHVQTQHGTPLKKLGLDLREHPIAAAGMNFDRLVEHCGRWDFLVAPNPHSSEVWKRVYPGNYQVLEVGYPRNDILAVATGEQIAAARSNLAINPEQTTILYAPTHRDDQPDFTPMIDIGAWAETLGSDYTLLVRTHYFYPGPAGLGQPEHGARVVDVSDHSGVEELCLAADVLVTDYSAIMFDYATLDRPIAIYAPDWAAYRRTRGVYFDILAEPPGAVATSPEQLAGLFRTGAFRSPAATEARMRFRSKFCPHDNGDAAELVVRHVLLGQTANPLSRPRSIR